MGLARKCAAGIATTTMVAGLVVSGAGMVLAAPGYPPAPPANSSMQSRPLLPTLEGGAYAVDGSDLYVADTALHRAIRIIPGVEEPITLPFTGLHSPSGIAVENGNVYVTDTGNDRVLALLNGQSTPAVLPFDGLSRPGAIAVEGGTVYVADTGNHRILALRAGESTPTVLPFGELSVGGHLAVDDGNVYTTDSSGNRVVELPSGATTPTVLPFKTNNTITGLTVDHGDVYFFDLESTWMSIPFGSLTQAPPADGIYQASAGSARAWKLQFGRFSEPAVLHIDNRKGYLVDGVHEAVPQVLTPFVLIDGTGGGSLGLPFGS
ncbi:hypothetical protein M2280_004727 [Prescottella agglutinans]|uniref:Uncharacterized protein n=2 Tax=Prescottella agglutinans TaxID=1644129 RepID=A0ABT6MJF8_9NOCA|nr:hypothetical protein [Prescottella agglutinans]